MKGPIGGYHGTTKWGTTIYVMKGVPLEDTMVQRRGGTMVYNKGVPLEGIMAQRRGPIGGYYGITKWSHWRVPQYHERRNDHKSFMNSD